MSEELPEAAEAAGPEEGPPTGWTTRLDQPAIDALTGFRPAPQPAPPDGLRGVAEARIPGAPRMPILEAALADLAERASARLRAAMACDAEVALRRLGPLRFADATDDILLPSCVGLFQAEGWGGPLLVVLGPGLARAALDRLMGGGAERGGSPVPVRPFTPIEAAILFRLAGSVLEEGTAAFAPIAPTTFTPLRCEADPRLAAIARPADATLRASFAVELDGRGGDLDLIVPLATLESVMPRLREGFPGVKLGRDAFWAGHLADGVARAEVEAGVVLHEMRLPLRRVMSLAVGDTLTFDAKPTDPVEVRCGGQVLTRGRIGRVDGRIAVQVTEPLRRGAGGARAWP